jgi:hypothetical protein
MSTSRAGRAVPAPKEYWGTVAPHRRLLLAEIPLTMRRTLTLASYGSFHLTIPFKPNAGASWQEYGVSCIDTSTKTLKRRA